MKIPPYKIAEQYISDAEQLNPGAWVKHSLYVAKAAQQIAIFHPHLDSKAAFVMGLLHDIGRRTGAIGMRHTLDGYNFLKSEGYDDAARICLTHSFPIQDPKASAAEWDCTHEELAFIRDYFQNIEYTLYDRLIQLCDALALPTGFCLMEKRLVDVSMRYGVNQYTVPRWEAYLEIKRSFEKEIGRSVYTLLPGVIENTFGFSLE